MPEISADFGIILAYIIPGFFCLWSLSYLYRPLGLQFRRTTEGEQRAVAVFSLVAICLVTGMFLSLIRSAAIDNSFNLEIQRSLCLDSKNSPECAPVGRVDPNYGAITCEGIRESFLLAESRYKRPYQFYGNMVLVLFPAGAAGIAFVWRSRTSSSRVNGLKFTILVIIWLAAIYAFYQGARRAHYRFTNAVEILNMADCTTAKHVPGRINFEIQHHN